MRALKMRSTAARPLEGDDDQLRVIMEADPLTTKWEAAKGLNVNCSMVAQHLKRIEKVKYLTKWVLHELISYPKYHHFEALSSYSMQQQWTISQYNCDMWWKSRFYTTTSSDQLSGWTNEKLQSTSQSHAYIKKKGHCHCLMVCRQSDSLQNSESQRNHYIWEVCSANQWDAPKMATPAAGIGQQKGPNSSRHCPQIAQSNINILLPFIFHSTGSRSELVLFSMAPGTEF